MFCDNFFEVSLDPKNNPTADPNILFQGEGVSCCDHVYMIHTVNGRFKSTENLDALAKLGGFYKIYAKQHEKFWDGIISYLIASTWKEKFGDEISAVVLGLLVEKILKAIHYNMHYIKFLSSHHEDGYFRTMPEGLVELSDSVIFNFLSVKYGIEQSKQFFSMFIGYGDYLSKLPAKSLIETCLYTIALSLSDIKFEDKDHTELIIILKQNLVNYVQGEQSPDVFDKTVSISTMITQFSVMMKSPSFTVFI